MLVVKQVQHTPAFDAGKSFGSLMVRRSLEFKGAHDVPHTA
jgi:hypothetical protein